MREWLGARTAVLIVFIVAVALLASFYQAMIARDGGAHLVKQERSLTVDLG